MAELNITIGIEDNASRQIREIDRALNGLNRNLGGLGSSSNNAAGGLAKFSAVATGAAAALTVVATTAIAAGAAMVNATTSITQLQNRLSLITDSNEELAATYERLQAVAVQNRTSFAGTVDLYTRLTLATEELGYSSSQVEQITTKFSQALAISGADANTASGAITQFAQAMGSGVVRGDEFNSLVDALGPALAIMARESGISVGELRKMANEGRLTADAFAQMLLGSQQLTTQFNKMDETVPQVAQKLADSWDRFLASADKSYGVSQKLADMLNLLNNAIDVGPTPDTFSEIEKEIMSLTGEMEDLYAQAAKIQKDAGLSGWQVFLNKISFGSLNEELFDVEMQLEALDDRQQELLDKRGEILSALIGKPREEITNEDLAAYQEKIALYDQEKRAQAEAQAAAEAAANAETARLARQSAAYKEYYASRMEGLKLQNEQNAALVNLLAANQSSLSSEQQLTIQYNEKRAAIEALNQQLLTNATLTDAQRTQIENTIAGLTAEKNALYENITMGQTVTDVYNNSVGALQANKAAYDELINARTQVISQMQSEQFQTEANQAFLAALNGAIAANRQEYAALTGELQATGASLSQFEQYYQQLIASASSAVASQDNMSAAVIRLDADLRAGIISLDQYAAAMAQIGDVTPPTFDQQLMTLKGNVDAALAQNAANEKLVATLKEQGATTAQITEAEKQLGIVRRTARSSGGGGAPKLDPYEQFYKGILDQSTRAANEIPYAQQALAQLNKEFEAGAISLEVYKNASEKINDILGNKTVSVVGVIQDSLSSLAGSISNTLTDVFMGVKGGFEGLQDIALSVVRSIVNSLIQNFIVSPLLKNINNALSAAFTPSTGGGLFGGGGGLFGLIGGLFGLPFFEGGGYTGNSARAGGLDGKGGFPAIIHPNETIIDHSKGQMLASGTNSEPIVVNFNISAIDTQTGTEFLMKNKQLIVGSVQEAYNRRGQRGPYG